MVLAICSCSRLPSPALCGASERARARLGLWWAFAFVRTGADRSSWRRMPQGARCATPHHAAARSARIICRRHTAMRCNAAPHRISPGRHWVRCGVCLFVCLVAQHGRQTNFRNLKRNGQNHKAPEVLQGSHGYSIQGSQGYPLQGTHGCSRVLTPGCLRVLTPGYSRVLTTGCSRVLTPGYSSI